MPADPLDTALLAAAPVAVAGPYRTGVAFWLDILAGHEAVFNEVDLRDEDEPAPVFRA